MLSMLERYLSFDKSMLGRYFTGMNSSIARE